MHKDFIKIIKYFSFYLFSGAYDPQTFAMNYHIVGIRECASEVARYLITHEGMNIEDPLRVRLMSHLQGFVTQREISVKSTQGAVSGAVSPSWSPHHASYHSLPHHQGTYASAVAPPLPPTPTHITSVTPHHPSMYHQSGYASTQLSNSNGYSYIPNLPTAIPTSTVGSGLTDPITSTTTTSTIQSDGSLLTEHSQQHVHQHQQHYSHHEDQNGQTYIDISSNIHRNTAASIGYGNPQYPTASAQGYGNNNGNGVDNSTSATSYNNNNKPYRPWGTGPEMAY